MCDLGALQPVMQSRWAPPPFFCLLICPVISSPPLSRCRRHELRDEAIPLRRSVCGGAGKGHETAFIIGRRSMLCHILSGGGGAEGGRGGIVSFI